MKTCLNRKLMVGLILPVLGSLLLLLTVGVPPSEAQVKTITRYMDPIQVPGDLLYLRLSSSYIPSLRMFSFSGGTWRHIPFQIDERDEFGAFILPEGPEPSMLSAKDRVDMQDFLLFMVSDLGDKAPVGNFISGEGYEEAFRLEIEITDPVTGGKGWAYIVSLDGTPPPLPEKYVNVALDDCLAISTKYYKLTGLSNRFGKETDKTNRPERFSIFPAAGGDGENILDRVKIRGEATALHLFKFVVNEENTRGGVLRYKSGPIRALVSGNLRYPVPYPLSRLPEMETTIDSFYYDRIAVFTARAQGKNFYFSLATDSKVGMGVDLNPHAYGMKFANSVNPVEVTVDGVMSEAENKMNEAHDQWRYYSGAPGTIVIRGRYDANLIRNAGLYTRYVDDINSATPPESLPGQIGYSYDYAAGKNIFKYWLTTSFHFYVPDNMYQKDAAEKLKILQDANNVHDQPLKITVDEEEVANEITSSFSLRPR